MNAAEHDQVTLASGRRVFLLKSILGEGKAGVVYDAEALCRLRGGVQAGSEIAVKIYKREILRFPNQVERLAREARISSRVDHPNVVRVHGLYSTSHGECLVMERTSGGTLREALPTASSQWRRSLCVQLLEGLTALHEARIIHRDIKPENLLLKDGRLKIADFGVARLHDETIVTASSQFLGTIRYAAPESLFEGRTSAQSDQYSAGTVLFEIMTGEPWIYPRGTFAAQVVELRNRHKVRAEYIERDTAAAIVRNEVIKRLLSYEPERRFRTTSRAMEAYRDTVDSQYWVEVGRTFVTRHRDTQVQQVELRRRAQEFLDRLPELEEAGDCGPYGQIAVLEFCHNHTECPVCEMPALERPDQDGTRRCRYCSYTILGRAEEWRALMRILRGVAKPYAVVAIAAALEGGNKMPSEPTLHRVVKMLPR